MSFEPCNHHFGKLSNGYFSDTNPFRAINAAKIANKIQLMGYNSGTWKHQSFYFCPWKKKRILIFFSFDFKNSYNKSKKYPINKQLLMQLKKKTNFTIMDIQKRYLNITWMTTGHIICDLFEIPSRRRCRMNLMSFCYFSLMKMSWLSTKMIQFL